LSTVLACNLAALTPDQRQRRAELFARLAGSRLELVETPSGYRLAFPSSPALAAELAEWVALERVCCPFLGFEPEGTRLELTVPPAAREWVRTWL
jgi:hypothetical protein